jgi:hypothetical protein
MATATIKKVKFELVNMEFDGKKEVGTGVLKFNEKEYDYRAVESYNKVHVSVEGFLSESQLKEFGIVVDQSEIETKFHAEKKLARMSEKARTKKAHEEAYDNHIFVTKIIKEIAGAKLTRTRDEYINEEFSPSLGISYVEAYKGNEISINISVGTTYSSGSFYARATGTKYTIERGYSKEEKTWCKNSKDIKPRFDKMLAEAKQSIDWKIESQKKKASLLEQVNEELDGRVVATTIGHYGSRNNWYSEAAFEKQGITFKVEDSKKAAKYTIKKIEKEITAKQMQAILAILK